MCHVPVLARKPGALRNGAPFKDWGLPAALKRVRRKLTGAEDGNRQMSALHCGVERQHVVRTRHGDKRFGQCLGGEWDR